MNEKIIISFAITIFLILILGLISIYKIIELSSLTQKLHDHPFVVTNATKNIQSHIISMHRYMKDVSTSHNEEELQIAIGKVNKNEEMVYKEYKTIFKIYLGEKADIQKSYKAFADWKDIRDEIVLLMEQNKKDEAQFITKNKGYMHVLYLDEQVEILVNYAHNKAEEFLSYAHKDKEGSIVFISILLILIILIITILLIFLLKKLSIYEKEKLESIEKLKEKTSDLLKAQDIAKIGFWKYNIDEDILTWGDETYKMFQIDKIQNPVKKLDDFFSKLDSHYIKEVAQAYDEHLKNKKPYAITHKLILNDGTIKWIREREM